LEKLENLQLIEVEITDGKATMLFANDDMTLGYPVSFNKNIYDNLQNKFVADDEKAAKVEEWCKEHFDTEFDNLPNCKGVRKDIYAYDDFNSLWKSERPNKFPLDWEKKLFNTEIKDITADDVAIRIQYEIDGDLYETKYTYAKYLEAEKKYITIPSDKRKKLAKFHEVMGLPFEDKDSLIGKTITIQVKTCFGDKTYAEILQVM
jgi:hypothetical protein